MKKRIHVRSIQYTNIDFLCVLKKNNHLLQYYFRSAPFLGF